ncbi:MAG TPA: hypothetical protein VIR98_00865 [Candidatus Paceibacterota bacterium]|jgi:hypothetical protein
MYSSTPTQPPPGTKLSRQTARALLATAWAKKITREDALRTLDQVAAGLLLEDHFDVAVAKAHLGSEFETLRRSAEERYRAQARAGDCMHRRVSGSYGAGKRR